MSTSTRMALSACQFYTMVSEGYSLGKRGVYTFRMERGADGAVGLHEHLVHALEREEKDETL